MSERLLVSLLSLAFTLACGGLVALIVWKLLRGLTGAW